MSINKSKVVAAAVGFSLALSAFVGVGAASAGAQAMTLSQLVDLFISLGIISSDKAAAAKAAVTSTATATTFNQDLTIGSTGADVTALQVAVGVTPATGYFGPITKAAVQAYQASKGIITTGYVGPLTRAALNGSVTTTTTTTTTTGGTTTTVVNTGIEGTLSVSKSSVSDSTVREGDSMKPVLGIKLEAKLSDINIQRVKLDLGTVTTIYTKVYKALYLTDDSGKVLASADLNSNTVVKNGSNYELTLGGFSYNVAKDSTKYLWVKADVYSTIRDADATSRTISLAANGVRGTDGAGIDQYAPSTAISQSVSVSRSLIDSAALKLSTNSANIKSADVVASEGTSDNEADEVAALIFDLKAEKDAVLLTDIVATVTKSGSGAATTTKAYLFDGSTMLDSEDFVLGATTGTVTFDDLDLEIAKDSTKVLTLKYDIREADGTDATFTVAIAANGVSSENSEGSTITATGSATGEALVVRNAGLAITLAGTPTITKGATPVQADQSTSTASALFNVNLKAIGNDVFFGAQAGSSTFAFKVYQAGVATDLQVASSTAWSTPSSGVVTSGVTGSAFKLQENNEVSIPVTFIFEGRVLATGAFVTNTSYAVGLDSVKWATTDGGASVTSDFMSGESAWKTSTIALP